MKNLVNDLDVKEIIREIKDNRIFDNRIVASVIIVTYNQSDLLLQNLKSLNKQTVRYFEIIIIDNNEKMDIYTLIKDYSINYIKLNKNYGLSLGRNIGIKYARGEIVIFLDDDALPAQDFVEQHIKAYQTDNILGLRGKSLPRNPGNIYNYFASHYDYGDKIIPCYINLEGNSSFKRKALLKIGGFNPDLAGAGGYEGTELSYRILQKYKDRDKLIYYPNAIIYHDFYKNYIGYIKKLLRHKKNKNKLENQFDKVFKITKDYNFKKNMISEKPQNLLFRFRIRVIKKSAQILLKMYQLINPF